MATIIERMDEIDEKYKDIEERLRALEMDEVVTALCARVSNLKGRVTDLEELLKISEV
jgi:hypothetical protein